MNFKKGTQRHKVYETLLTHEFMKKSTLAAKTGIPLSILSNYLTDLRRCGLAEYSGIFGSNLHWKKHPEDTPLYPAQPDILKRKNKNSNLTPKVTSQMRFSRATKLLNEAIKELNQAQQDCSDSVFVDSGVEMDGIKLYKKAEE